MSDGTGRVMIGYRVVAAVIDLILPLTLVKGLGAATWFGRFGMGTSAQARDNADAAAFAILLAAYYVVTEVVYRVLARRSGRTAGLRVLGLERRASDGSSHAPFPQATLHPLLGMASAGVCWALHWPMLWGGLPVHDRLLGVRVVKG